MSLPQTRMLLVRHSRPTSCLASRHFMIAAPSDHTPSIRASSSKSLPERGDSTSIHKIINPARTKPRLYRTNADCPNRGISSKTDRRHLNPVTRVSTREVPTIPRSSHKSPSPSTPDHTPGSDAARSAEARDAALRAARIRRASQRQDAAVEAEKKELAQHEYRKKYNSKARKWVSSIIALPILLVTSYYLFDRLALGNAPKQIPRLKQTDE